MEASGVGGGAPCARLSTRGAEEGTVGLGATPRTCRISPACGAGVASEGALAGSGTVQAAADTAASITAERRIRDALMTTGQTIPG